MTLNPTPVLPGDDLGNVLLANPESRSYLPLKDALASEFADLKHVACGESGHSMPLPAVVAPMSSLVPLVSGLISPREMRRIAASAISTDVSRGLTRRAGAVSDLADGAMRVDDALISPSGSDSSIPLQQIAGEGPALGRFSDVDLAPEPSAEVFRHVHRVANA